MEGGVKRIRASRFQQVSMDQYLRRPESRLDDVLGLMNETIGDSQVASKVEIEIKYAGYVQRELGVANRLKSNEERKIPADLNYQEIKGLGREAREKLDKIRP